EVGVDHAGRLGGGGADGNGPGTDFLHAGGEIGLQTQQLVAGADDAIQAGLGHAHVFQEDGLVLVVQVGDLGLDGGADGDHGGVFRRRVVLYGLQVRIVLEAVVLDVGDVHGALGGDEAIALHQGLLVFVQAQAAHGFALVQDRHDALQQGDQADGFLVAGIGQLAVLLQRFVGGGQVGQGQLGVDDLDVGHGIDAAGHVDDVLVFETAHDVDDGVGLADVGEEL